MIHHEKKAGLVERHRQESWVSLYAYKAHKLWCFVLFPFSTRVYQEKWGKLKTNYKIIWTSLKLKRKYIYFFELDTCFGPRFSLLIATSCLPIASTSDIVRCVWVEIQHCFGQRVTHGTIGADTQVVSIVTALLASLELWWFTPAEILSTVFSYPALFTKWKCCFRSVCLQLFQSGPMNSAGDSRRAEIYLQHIVGAAVMFVRIGHSG